MVMVPALAIVVQSCVAHRMLVALSCPVPIVEHVGLAITASQARSVTQVAQQANGTRASASVDLSMAHLLLLHHQRRRLKAHLLLHHHQSRRGCQQAGQPGQEHVVRFHSLTTKVDGKSQSAVKHAGKISNASDSRSGKLGGLTMLASFTYQVERPNLQVTCQRALHGMVMSMVLPQSRRLTPIVVPSASSAR